MSHAFDNPAAREAHGFPIDPVEKEVKQALDSVMGTDKPR